MNLEAYTLEVLFAWFLVFCRLGTALSFLPGVSELYIPVRARLFLGIFLSIIVSASLREELPGLPEHAIDLFLLLLGEVTLGIALGISVKMFLYVTHLTGMMMAYQMGLGAAVLFDPSTESQGSVIGNLLMYTTILLIFVTNLHHLFIIGFVDSYESFKPFTGFAAGDFAELMTSLVAKIFLVAFQIASPLIVVGLILYLGAGVISRLMPSMHIFFVLMPLQIWVGFIILGMIFSSAMMWYMNYYEETVGHILYP